MNSEIFRQLTSRTLSVTLLAANSGSDSKPLRQVPTAAWTAAMPKVVGHNTSSEALCEIFLRVA